MMQLVCNGIALDLLDGASLSFQKTNPLFAFDELECERTQSFELPATATNDRVFGLAKLPAYRGEGMRRKFDAELRAGVVVKTGFLYVDSYDARKRVYNAVFVYGELMALKALADKGKLSELPFVGTDVSCQYGGTYVIGENDDFRTIPFYRDIDGTLALNMSRPSIAVGSLLRRVAGRYGVSVEIPSEMESVRIVLGSVTDVYGERSENPTGRSCLLSRNMPEVTFGELLKHIAYLSGGMITASGNTISVVKDIENAQTMNLSGKLIERGNIVRNVADMAQRNHIIAKTYNATPDVTERSLLTYIVDNDNIEEEKTLFSFGYTIPTTNLQREQTGIDYVVVNDDDSMALYGGRGNLISATQIGVIPRNEFIARLFDASTSIEINAKMSFFEYEQITASTFALLDGTMYAWTDAEWADGVAKITLNAI